MCTNYWIVSLQANPFSNDTHMMDDRERLRVAIFSVTILPIRVVLFATLLMICYALAAIATAGIR